MAVDVASAAPAPAPPPRDLRRRLVTLVALVAISAAMVYGTWLAVDDMGAKPIAGEVALDGDAVRIVNTSGFAWSDARLVIDGAFAAPVQPGPVAPGAVLRVSIAAFVDGQGRQASQPREIAVAVTRVPRFPKLNRARTASGTWALR